MANRPKDASNSDQEIALIVSPFFYPEPISTGKYNTTLATALAETATRQVQVICSHPLFPKWEVETSREQLPGVLAIRGGAWLSYPKSALLRRAMLELWFTGHVALTIARMRIKRQKIGEVIFIFPPSAMAVVADWLLPATVLRIGIVHDLQAVYAARKSNFVKSVVGAAIHLVERRSFQICHRLVFLSQTMKKWAVENYRLTGSEIEVFYPFVNLDSDAPTKDSVAQISQIIDKTKRSIVYSGGLGEKQAPNELFDFFSWVVENFPEWRAYIFSQGPEYEKLKERKGGENICFHSLVPESLLSALLLSSDIQVVPQASGTSEGSLPSKVPNIISAKATLLCITDPDSELATLVAAYKKGVVCYGWETLKLGAAFREAVACQALDDGDSRLLNKFKPDGLIEFCLK